MTSEKDLIGTDIEAYLERYQNKELLRFVAVGSVDDGKSTLIGRLLFDTGMVYQDHLDQIRRASTQEGMEIDLSLLTDGLTAEREQGITIDVAYRYFTTEKRKFIIADTPGHIQYTRNMVTGASTANVAIILIDARLGVLQQSRRHAYIASMLGIPHLAVCVNKMDLVAYEPARFEAIRAEFTEFTKGLNFKDVCFFPISALKGVNCVNRGTETPWYEGPTVLEFLETVPVVADRNFEDFRYPVQYVLRPNLDYRGFAGQIVSGIVKPGDPIMVLPSGRKSTVKSLDVFEGSLDEAFTPQSIVIRLADEVDVSRGDMLVHPTNAPRVTRTFDAFLVWMHETGLDPEKSYLLKHTTQLTRVDFDAVKFRVDMDTLAETAATSLGLNDIARVTLTTHKPLYCDAYLKNRATGSFIVIDSITNNTVAAGMIIADDAKQDVDDALRAALDTSAVARSQISARERFERFGVRGATVVITSDDETRGLALAYAVERRLFDEGKSGAVVGSNVADAAVLERAGIVGIAVAKDAAAKPDASVVFAMPDGADLEAMVTAVFAMLAELEKFA